MKPLLKSCPILFALTLAACGDNSVRDTLGLTRNAPDEFTVVSRPPLSVPPEFTLRPPHPGEAPRGSTTDAQARDLLIGKTPGSSNPATDATLMAPTVDTAVMPVTRSDVLSGGAVSLLKRAGADNADDAIRDRLTTDATTPRDVSGAGNLLDRLTGDEKPEPVVDAKKEAERLRNNKDANKPITEGEVPEEATKKKSLIDRIF